MLRSEPVSFADFSCAPKITLVVVHVVSLFDCCFYAGLYIN